MYRNFRFRQMLIIFMAVLLFCLLPGEKGPAEGTEETVSGAAGEAQINPGTEEIYVVAGSRGPEDHEALERYIRTSLGITDDSGKMMAGTGTVAREGLSEELQGLYDEIVEKAGWVSKGVQSSTVFCFPGPDMLDNAGYTAEELECENLEGERARYALSRKMFEQVRLVMKALWADSPGELYWYDGAYRMSFDQSFDVRTDGERMYLKSGTLMIRMSVRAPFSATGEGDTCEINTAIGRNITAARENAAAIVAANRGKSDYGKLKGYADAICGLAEYDHYSAVEPKPADADLKSWTMINVLDGDPETKAVCLGYSQAFRYLCSLSRFNDVEVYCVSGTFSATTTSPGSHIWNIVRTGGRNYLADITNSDGGDACDGLLFMKGYTGQDGGTWIISLQEKLTVYYTPGPDSLQVLSADYLALSDTDYTEWEDPAYTKIRDFVKRCYTVLLNRDPDGSGLEDWVFRLMDGKNTAADIIYGFVCSGEFQGRALGSGEAVETVCRAMLNRSCGEAEKDKWARMLENGADWAEIINEISGSEEFRSLCANYGITAGNVQEEEEGILGPAVRTVKTGPESEAVTEHIGKSGNNAVRGAKTSRTEKTESGTAAAENGFLKENSGPAEADKGAEAMAAAGADEAVEAAAEAVGAAETAAEAVGAAETAAGFPAVSREKAEAFVRRCYRYALGREAGPEEIGGWVGQMETGKAGPEAVIRGFLLSEEFRAREIGREETICILYKICLNREPDADGLRYWTDKAERGAGTGEIIREFMASREFAALMTGENE